MYSRLINGLLNLKFLVGLEEFIEFACSKPERMDGKIKCPCTLTKGQCNIDGCILSIGNSLLL